MTTDQKDRDLIEMRRLQERALKEGRIGDLAQNRYGEAEIEQAVLEPLPNPCPPQQPHQVQVIYWHFAEFTSKCPRSGYPDFAAINIWLVPYDSIIELKSLKLYLNSFRDRYIFHEAVPRAILEAIVLFAYPLAARIFCDFAPRGNLYTGIRAEWKTDGPESYLIRDLPERLFCEASRSPWSASLR